MVGKFRSIVLLLVFLGAFATNCSSERGEERVTYEVRGKVVRVEAARRSIVIDHEEIPGFMEAMTMPFEVRDSAILDGIEKGQEVEFSMVVQGNHAWITKIGPAGPRGGPQ